MNREQRRKVERKFDIKKYIEQSNAIEGIHDEAEITQSLKAWELLKDQEEIGHALICQIQRTITENQPELKKEWRGYYRTHSGVEVTVGGRHAPAAVMVDSLMEGWLADLPLMSPLIAHIRFESIHPFADGNGRTGRMIYWWHALKKGKVPFLYNSSDDIKVEYNRQSYYRLFDHDRVIKLSNAKWGIGWDGQRNIIEGEEA